MGGSRGLGDASGRTVGVYGQLPRLTLAVRGFGHLAQLARRWRQDRRRAVLIALASVAGDVALATAQRRGRQPGPWARATFDAADMGCSVVGSGAREGVWLPAFNGIEMSRGAERGFVELAGRNAVPIVPGARPLPTQPGEWLQALARVVGPMAATIGTLLASRRIGPRDIPMASIGGAIMLGFGGYLARLRDREQQQARALWAERAEDEVDRARFAARYRAATEHHDGHNFKRVLYALGEHSPACRAAARQAAARPAQVSAERTDGGTLAEAARYHDIHPPEAGATWVTTTQAVRLRNLIEEAESQPLSTDPRLVVGRRRGNDVEVTYFGHRSWLIAPAPRFEANLDPIAAALAAVTLYRLAFIHPFVGGFRARTALGLSAIDGMLFLAVTRTPAASPRPVRPILAAATGSSLAWYAVTIRGHAAEVNSMGTPTNPGMTGASVLGCIAYYWDDLGWLAWPLAAVIYGGLLAVLLARRTPTDTGFIVAELLGAAQFPLGAGGLRRRLAEERDLLAEELAEQFVNESEAARQEEHARERDRIAGLVDLAEAELDRLIDDPTVPLASGDVALWRHEMTRVRAWVNSAAS